MKLEVGKAYITESEEFVEILSLLPGGVYVGVVSESQESSKKGHWRNVELWKFDGSKHTGLPLRRIVEEIIPKRKLLAWIRTDNKSESYAKGMVIWCDEHEIISGAWERFPGLDQEL